MNHDREIIIGNEDQFQPSPTDASFHGRSREQFSCRSRVRNIMQGWRFEVLIIGLVILNCIIVVSELIFHIEGMLSQNFEVAQGLHIVSVAILTLFLIELAFRVSAFQLEFFSFRWEVFDALVIVVAFALEAAFFEPVATASGVGLIICLRFWRVARILNGVVLAVKRQSEGVLQKERVQRERAEEEISRLRQELTTQRTTLELVLRGLRKEGIQSLPGIDLHRLQMEFDPPRITLQEAGPSGL